jgi:hypothetical protein
MSSVTPARSLIAVPRRAWRWTPNHWLVLAGLLGAIGVGAGTALWPLQTMAAAAVIGVVVLIWVRPALGAYLLIGVTPLIVGISRGVAVPLLRPNELMALIIGFALVTRALVQLRTGQFPKLRLDRVEVSMVLLAIFSSVVPLAMMTLRQQPITTDDLLYALVLWKYLGLYVLVRMSISTEAQIRRCLWISVAAASVVAVLAILQSLQLFGVPRLLATYFVPFGYNGSTAAFAARGSSTLALPAATADLMVYNLAIVSGLWMQSRRHRALLACAAGLLVVGALSAGEFSSAIGLVVAVVCIAAVTNSTRLLKIFVPTGLVGSALLQPVLAARLSGFQSVSGLPVSWTGRIQNLQNYFWPQLFSNWNFLLGVRPTARVHVPAQASGYVWIESGYTWLLWGGGIPLLASFVFFVVVTAKRGWDAARHNSGARRVAGIATFVAVSVTTVLMAFDPHLTYRGSADLMFALIALTTAGLKRPGTRNDKINRTAPAKEVRT